ncbi:integrase core domain-containing protein [Streptomyces sp. NPDC026665]|uniref:integrase core domain-containing protein n=1 Tax=Streptomyces sp. NPDC026665 TaxID=3154798 RepID=UPI0033C718DA
MQKTCRELDIRQSMGRTGSCYDNAAAESFFGSLKTEIGKETWPTKAEARADVFRWIAYYNNHRLHSAIGYQTPREERQRRSHILALAA